MRSPGRTSGRSRFGFSWRLVAKAGPARAAAAGHGNSDCDAGGVADAAAGWRGAWREGGAATRRQADVTNVRDGWITGLHLPREAAGGGPRAEAGASRLKSAWWRGRAPSS